MTVRGFLQALIDIHNAKVGDNRKFTLGAVTVTDSNDSLYRYTNYEKTIECINEKLIDKLGGHMRVRKERGVRYLDYSLCRLRHPAVRQERLLGLRRHGGGQGPAGKQLYPAALLLHPSLGNGLFGLGNRPVRR